MLAQPHLWGSFSPYICAQHLLGMPNMPHAKRHHNFITFHVLRYAQHCTTHRARRVAHLKACRLYKSSMLPLVDRPGLTSSDLISRCATFAPTLDRWPETTSTARENSHGFQDFLPYLQHKRFCGVLDHLHSVAGFMACLASRSCASWGICQNGSGKAIRCKCFTNHSSCVIS